jgi:hypothetical protein
MIAILIIQFSAIAFLGYKLYNIKREKIVDKIKEEGVILPNPVSVPGFNQIDPNYQMLKDVVESIKLEKWDIIKFERDHMDNLYDIELLNGPGSLKVKCRLRVRDYGDRNLYISWFHIFKMVNKDQHSHVVTFNDCQSVPRFLILNLMWDYVLDHHQKIYDEHIHHYLECKKEIAKELKTLNRDKQLVKLLEN